jgi:hypothetical protein
LIGMTTGKPDFLAGFLSAAPVNLALVMGVVAFPDYAWDIILGAASFLFALLLPKPRLGGRRR